MSIKLGVNVDHIATLREVRKVDYPNLLDAVKIVNKAGAEGITIHLREDRRHIQTDDLIQIAKMPVHLNLEIALNSDALELALKHKPAECCLVPEKRQELTTEGGLDVLKNFEQIKKITKQLQQNKIKVSLFVEPETKTIEAAQKIGVEMIEIHTGEYANARGENQINQLEKIKKAAKLASSIGLQVNAGHGLTLENVKKIAQIAEISWLNIGHSIVSDAIFVGLKQAVLDMKNAIADAKK